ncbi:MAG TPA: PilT/PilU family type 4a pilus ATPase [Acidimicrobiales bacterium]|jgi:twitching motility protein PilT|nr:PilT/PilU family type 4a pilus ATPase [Acidimicrobiales bacterium]
MHSPSRLVAEFLVDRKVLSRDAAEEAVEEEASTGVPLAKILSSRGMVGERDLVAAVASQLQLDFWDPQLAPIAPMVDGLIPPLLALRHRAVAVATDGDTLVVAMEDPGDAAGITAIEKETGWQVRPALAASADLRAALAATYPGADEGVEGSDADAGLVEEGELHLNTLLTRVVELGASDLHLSVGIPPTVRVDGGVAPMEGLEPLNGSEVRRLIYGILTQRQRERFEAELELDTSHAVPNVGRFRVNVFLQRDNVGAVLRTIPYKIVPLEALGVPAVVGELAKLPRGLVLVTGPTGSGKSTTLASMVDVINSTRALHIMTVEDPIEFLHSHKRSIVNQREVGDDTTSFASALKHVLRQDPDVILVGEMRDLETISAALTAAETGHLVFGTLHTQDAPQSVDRIIDVFPSHQQQQIRVQLASALQAVVTQQLLPRHRVKGRVAACEVLVATAAVRNLIREGKTHQIYSSMQSGGKQGMQTMDQSLAELVRQGKVSMEAALERCGHEADLRRLVSGVR